jgi:hypothetical protein
LGKKIGARIVCLRVGHVLKPFGLNILSNYSSRVKNPFLTIFLLPSQKV